MKERLHQEQTDHQNEFRITGISRSGNHAVINWILGHIQDKEFCFLNCAEPKFNPYETCRPLGPDEDSWYTNIPDFCIDEERKGNFMTKDYLLYSHEDSFLGPLENGEFKKNRERWIGKAKNRKDILIIRDPFNLFASRRKAGFLLGHEPDAGPKPMSVHSVRRIYKQHAKEVLGKSNFLKEKVVINFNRWVKNPVYREEIAVELGLEHTDEGMQEVSKVAGGSSFDGTSITAEALHQKLEERWKIYAPDPAFQEIFDAELVALSKEIFGETEALKAMLGYSEKKEEINYSV